MKIYDKDDLYYLGASNKRYEEKMRILNEQKDFVSKANEVIDMTIQELETGGYLTDMTYNKQKLSKSIITDFCLALPFDVISAICLSHGNDIMQMGKNPETVNKGFAYIVATFFITSLGTVFSAKTIYDLYNYALYTTRISSYQRRLK